MHSILIADDSNVYRKALSLTLKSGFDIVGEAIDCSSALELINRNKPDVVLLDLSMPKSSGLSIISEIRHISPATKILVTTMSDDMDHVNAAFDAGADGYFLKDLGNKELHHAIGTVLSGAKYICPYIASA